MPPYIRLLRPLVERNYTEYSGLSDRSDQSILFSITQIWVRSGQVRSRSGPYTHYPQCRQTVEEQVVTVMVASGRILNATQIDPSYSLGWRQYMLPMGTYESTRHAKRLSCASVVFARLTAIVTNTDRPHRCLAL